MQPLGEKIRSAWSRIRQTPCDPDAFRRVVERHSAQVLTVAYRALRDREEAEDAAQAVFVQVYSEMQVRDPRLPLSAWIYGLAVNESYRRVRRQATCGPVASLNQSLAKMPEEERLFLIWKEVEGYSTEEIARMSGREVREVELALSRGRKKLVRTGSLRVETARVGETAA